MSQTVDDEFELYDLRVEVIETGKPFVMHAKPGDTFDVIGGRIVFPPGREPSFSLYAMLAVLPFIPAKQRPTHPNDWMTTDTEIASPDPHCGAPPAHHAPRPAPASPRRLQRGAALRTCSPDGRHGPEGGSIGRKVSSVSSSASGVRFGPRSSTGKSAPASCQRPSRRRASGGVP